ncbi:MAG: cytochrome c [Rhodospirillales bacterium]|nr:cytochrome c [Rhodospirillales bacterium]MDH3911360.1 cytochrome c [Rhodospirillales bacterium]MDH3919232.1 cytochrome c [Rhodospirillales bacterium]MDH3967911.1 cytochrome c [Rhodospirillales bacterium]
MARRGHVIVIVVVLLVLVLALAVALTRPAAALPWQLDAVPRVGCEPGCDATLPGPVVTVVLDAQTGRQLAERWCSGCHVVEADSCVDQTPSFETIARDPSKTSERLRAWLMTPHSTMPDLTLSRSEVEAIIAYLKSLGDG